MSLSVNPLVLLNLSDHFTRSKLAGSFSKVGHCCGGSSSADANTSSSKPSSEAGNDPLLGILLGKIPEETTSSSSSSSKAKGKGNLHSMAGEKTSSSTLPSSLNLQLVHSFELPIEPNTSMQVDNEEERFKNSFDVSYFNQKMEQVKKIDPDLSLIGWYQILTGRSTKSEPEYIKHISLLHGQIEKEASRISEEGGLESLVSDLVYVEFSMEKLSTGAQENAKSFPIRVFKRKMTTGTVSAPESALSIVMAGSANPLHLNLSETEQICLKDLHTLEVNNNNNTNANDDKSKSEAKSDYSYVNADRTLTFVSAQIRNLELLREQVAAVVKYLLDKNDGGNSGNLTLLRDIAIISKNLKTNFKSNKLFNEQRKREYESALLHSLLSGLTSSITANHLLNNAKAYGSASHETDY